MNKWMINLRDGESGRIYWMNFFVLGWIHRLKLTKGSVDISL